MLWTSHSHYIFNITLQIFRNFDHEARHINLNRLSLRESKTYFKEVLLLSNVITIRDII